MTNNIDPLNPNAKYDVPKGDSKYMKFEDGNNEFLALGSAIIGWEYWNSDNKPVRLSERPDGPIEDLPGIRPDKDGVFRLKHFWAFPVIDVADGKVKVLEITQKGVQKAIRAIAENPKWGSPVMNFTITVTKSGQNLDTEYNTQANPKEEIPGAWTKAWKDVLKAGFDMNALYKGDDPFSADIPDTDVDEEADNEEPPE